jgi:hypothetical protein
MLCACFDRLRGSLLEGGSGLPRSFVIRREHADIPSSSPGIFLNLIEKLLKS